MDAGCKIICQVETLAQAREAADVGAPIASSRRDALLAAIRASREARWDLCRLWSIFRRPDRGGKSRLNFLDLLRAGPTDYVINEIARQCGLRRVDTLHAQHFDPDLADCRGTISY